MATTAQTFSDFLDAITATEYQKTTTIPARKRTVDQKLAEKFPPGSAMPYSKSILMGSAAKSTIIRPFDDVDVLAIFSNINGAWKTYAQDSKSFIYRIREAYSGVSIQQVGTRGQAVRVFYAAGGHVDVAPVFDAGNDIYFLPSGSGDWIRTAPTVGNQWFLERNATLGYHAAPLVRLLKAWNRTHSKRFRSFHLETVAATMFSSIGSNYRGALHMFFLSAARHLDVNDPAGQSGNLSSYLTAAGRQNLIQGLASAADRAGRAIEAEKVGDHAEAKRLWAIVLGQDFPT